MNRSLLTLLIISASGLPAAEPPDTSFLAQLIPPELVVQHRDEIKLTDQQFERIRQHAESGGSASMKFQQGIAIASKEMATILSVPEIDEAKALAQLEKILDAEREMKRMHLRTMIRIRNELTVDQIRVLAAKQATAGPQRPQDAVAQNALERRLRTKLTKIQQEVERRVENGVPPMEAVRIMQTFQQTMEAGRPNEAEVILDRVMKLLDISDSANPDGKPPAADQGTNDKTKPPAALDEVPVSEKLSAADVSAAVVALKRPDVAWRKIDWQTCLLEGLKRSRDQKKPILLWVFIDRPIDDERC